MPDAPVDYGRYKLIRRLALGGMAEVFLAHVAGPAGFSKTVVVKRIHPHLAQEEHLVEMFLSEARIAAQLNHPNIVQIFDLGEVSGSYFIAMEYIDGLNLRTLCRQAAKAGAQLPVEVVCKIAALACEGLAYAHEFNNPETGAPLNLVHRDVSSDNILLSFQGVVKVVDFGIAKAQTVSLHTETGTVRGKVPYMSPEQLRAEPLDRRADVFSLGVVLYELLAGVRPFEAASDVSLMQVIINQVPAPLFERRPDATEALSRILDKALAKNRDDRYQDCRALQADLEKVIAQIGKAVGMRDLAAFARAYPVPEQKEPSGERPLLESGAREARNTFVSVGPTTRNREAPERTTRPETSIPEVPFTVILEGSAENVLVKLMVSYAGHELAVEEHPADLAVMTDHGQRNMIRRNVEAESAAIKAVESVGLRYKPILGRFNAVGEAAVEIWARAQEIFPAGWKVVLPQRVRVAVKAPVKAVVSIRTQESRYRVDIKVSSDETAVDLPAVRVAARAGKRYVRLRNGEYAELDPRLAALDAVLTELDEDSDGFDLPAYELSNVARLVDAASAGEGGEELRLLASSLRRGVPLPPVEVPTEFSGALRPYQRVALHWISLLGSNGLNGVLADDAGLGKKITVLTALLIQTQQTDESHVVIAPAPVLAAWEQQAASFAPTLKVSRTKPTAGKTLWLLDWGKATAEHESLLSGRYGYLVLDEAQMLRDAPSSHILLLKAVPAKRRLALTGVPLETRLLALWSVFDFLMPGFLGGSDSFDFKYFGPIERDGDEQARDRLKARVQPFLLRRLKREVATEMPTRVGIARV